MLCNGNQLFLQQSPTSQCMHTSDNPHSRALRCLQIRLSSQHSQASNLELACGGGGQITLLFSVSIDRLDYRSVGHHSQSSQFLLQIPKSDYCSGSLSALYLIYNILPSPLLLISTFHSWLSLYFQHYSTAPVTRVTQSKSRLPSALCYNCSDELIISILCIIKPSLAVQLFIWNLFIEMF